MRVSVLLDLIKINSSPQRNNWEDKFVVKYLVNKDKLMGVESSMKAIVYLASHIINSMVEKKYEKKDPLKVQILEGLRTVDRQIKLCETGASKWKSNPESAPHCKGMAVDLLLQPFEGWGNIPKDRNLLCKEVQDIATERGRFYFLAGAMFSAYYMLKDSYCPDIELVWGGNFDRDNRFKDGTFLDLVHFEVR